MSHPDVVTLSKLGSNGHYKNKINSELESKLEPNPLKPAILNFSILYHIPKKVFQLKKSMMCPVPMLYPHVLFAIMFSNFQQVFMDRVCGGRFVNISNFWKSMRGNPMYQNHPIRANPNHVDKCIPLTLHGDGTPVVGCGKSWSKSVTAFSWTSALASAQTRFVNFLTAIICTSILASKTAMDPFWNELVWILTWLAKGEWPDRDSKGNLFEPGSFEFHMREHYRFLANGFFAILFILKGDLDYVANTLGLEHYSRVPGNCALCKANKTNIPWTEFNESASWLATVWKDFRTWRVANPNHCKLFSLAGLGATSFFPDLMHCKYLGSDMYFYGSVLVYMIWYALPNSKDKNMENLWECIREYYKTHAVSCQFQNLQRSMFEACKKSTFPCLKGKAAEIKHLGAALLHAFKTMVVEDDSWKQRIRLALQASLDIDTIIDIHPSEYCLPPHVATQFLKHVRLYCGLITSLGQHFGKPSGHPPRLPPMFHYTVKFHYLMHIGLLAQFVNPRISWCFQGEDMMQVVRRIVQACSNGTTPQAVCHKVFRRYISGLNMDFRDCEMKAV
jgi:hypothetical protein